MKVRALCMLLGLGLAFGCGASESGDGPGTDATPDAATGLPDGAVGTHRLVVVNALTDGTFDGVVLCVGSAKVPTTPMALTNTPGIATGTGIDLGEDIATPGPLKFEVFDAKKAANFADCPSLEFAQKNPPTATLTITTGVNLVTLVTDPGGVRFVADRFDETSSFVPDGVSARFVNLAQATGAASLQIGGKSVAISIDKASAVFSFAFDPGVSLVANAGTKSVTQSLQSVQYASDPTSNPKDFFGARKTFLVALVGDPQVPFDQSAAAPSRTGRELHLIAVPFGD